MNNQAPEKSIATLQDGEHLEVHSTFLTIQGEGPFAGRRAYFIRLAGCNLQCPGCDTEYTDGRKEITDWEIMSKVVDETENNRSTVIVITGGEPFRQHLLPLVNILYENGYTVQIETNGTLYPYGESHEIFKIATVVCSPKTGRVHQAFYQHCNFWKYVVKAGDVSEADGLPIHALDHSVGKGGVQRPPHGAVVYVQPMDMGSDSDTARSQNVRNLDIAVESVMEHGYTLCLQIHKIIGME